ncbi:glucose PTS transporter subunit EIIB [Klenkia taihuensis]|uniref:glucose PTS transporter subunit EIIB n=2 Tax=Klenkia taihuensis TaxID=1225127 RepID=UPI003908A015
MGSIRLRPRRCRPPRPFTPLGGALRKLIGSSPGSVVDCQPVRSGHDQLTGRMANLFAPCQPPRTGPGGDVVDKAEQIVAGLGGAQNIEEVEGCITRLRTEVRDASLVDQAALKAAGAHGVLVSGTVVQVVVGPEADSLADDVNDLL